MIFTVAVSFLSSRSPIFFQQLFIHASSIPFIPPTPTALQPPHPSSIPPSNPYPPRTTNPSPPQTPLSPNPDQPTLLPPPEPHYLSPLAPRTRILSYGPPPAILVRLISSQSFHQGPWTVARTMQLLHSTALADFMKRKRIPWRRDQGNLHIRRLTMVLERFWLPGASMTVSLKRGVGRLAGRGRLVGGD